MPLDRALQEARGPAEGQGWGVEADLRAARAQDPSRGSSYAAVANAPASTPAAWFDDAPAWKHLKRGWRFKGLLGAVAELCETLLLGAREKGAAWTAGTWLWPVVDVNVQGRKICHCVRNEYISRTSTETKWRLSYIPNQTPCWARFVPPAGCEHKVRVIKDTSTAVGHEGLR